MPSVSFYILTSEQEHAIDRTACRLAARAFDEGMRTLILVNDDSTATYLDDLLWQQPENRFIPHTRVSVDPKIDVRTWIATGTDQVREAQLLINLTHDKPHKFDSYDRIFEIVAKSNTEESREKYRFYRSRGCELDTYEIST